MIQRAYLYSRFERFWHWAQAVLVFLLLYSGFEVHGLFNLMGYEQAVYLHNTVVWAFLILIAFAMFWHFTTGERRQYLPTSQKLEQMIRFYLVGIFRGEPHPTAKTRRAKLNPLQRLTYLGLKLLVFPVQIISGFAYYFYNDLQALGVGVSLGVIAFVHTLAAYLLLAFVVAHVYLTTTGHTPLASIMAMITGWEELEEEESAGAEGVSA
jgi:thiosulfate reductase cytochrome b subunit